ncbi:ankyrin repeat domain-containing protein [bacterium]|nr:ankyrin repeat domain-containing protein [bacterium]
MKRSNWLVFLIIFIVSSCGSVETRSQGTDEQKSGTSKKQEGAVKGSSVNSGDIEQLVEAIRTGNKDAAVKMIDGGIDVNSKNKSGVYPLHWAAAKGDNDLVTILLGKKAYINATDGYREEPVIMWAAKKGRLETVKMLVEKGAAINISDRYKETPLMDAARYGHNEMLKLFLNNRANINDVTVDGMSALMFASQNGHTEIVKTLLEYRADINKIHFKTSKTALGYAKERNNKDIIAMISKQAKVEGDLIKRPAKPEDTEFVTTPPDEATLRKAWAGREDYLPASLNGKQVMVHMNKFLPDITQCYQNRYEQGDRNMMGTMELMVRVAGSGKILDIYFTTEKYQSSLFGDCILDAIKSRDFPMFYDGQVDFKYSYSI